MMTQIAASIVSTTLFISFIILINRRFPLRKKLFRIMMKYVLGFVFVLFLMVLMTAGFFENNPPWWIPLMFLLAFIILYCGLYLMISVLENMNEILLKLKIIEENEG